MKFYITSPIGLNVGKKSFDNEKEADEFKKKFSHAPAFKDSKIVKGTSDAYGFVTPVLLTESSNFAVHISPIGKMDREGVDFYIKLCKGRVEGETDKGFIVHFNHDYMRDNFIGQIKKHGAKLSVDVDMA